MVNKNFVPDLLRSGFVASAMENLAEFRDWLLRERKSRHGLSTPVLARLASDIAKRSGFTPGISQQQISSIEKDLSKKKLPLWWVYVYEAVGEWDARQAALAVDNRSLLDPARQKKGLTVSELDKLRVDGSGKVAGPEIGPPKLSVLPMRRVPLVGKIPAGGWRVAVEEATDLIPTTKGGPQTFALIPDGDSMNRVVPPGAIVFCDPDDRALRVGKLYAFMTQGGEVTFKKYLDNPPRLSPCSNNPEHEEMLVGEEPITIIGRIIGLMSDL